MSKVPRATAMVLRRGAAGNCSPSIKKGDIMKKKIPTVHLTYLAICIVMGLMAKRIVSPVTNMLTDFIRIPGGSAATAFSIMFLAVGCSAVNYYLAGTCSGFVQGIIALILGMSGYQGLLAIITYTIPGVVIDLIRRILKRIDLTYFVVCCCMANTLCACISNLLVFHLRSIALLLWLLIAASFGTGAGIVGNFIYIKISQTMDFRRMRYAKK